MNFIVKCNNLVYFTNMHKDIVENNTPILCKNCYDPQKNRDIIVQDFIYGITINAKFLRKDSRYYYFKAKDKKISKMIKDTSCEIKIVNERNTRFIVNKIYNIKIYNDNFPNFQWNFC